MAFAVQRFAVLTTIPVNMSDTLVAVGDDLQWMNMRYHWGVYGPNNTDLVPAARQRMLLSAADRYLEARSDPALSGRLIAWVHFCDTLITFTFAMTVVLMLHLTFLMFWEHISSAGRSATIRMLTWKAPPEESRNKPLPLPSALIWPRPELFMCLLGCTGLSQASGEMLGTGAKQSMLVGLAGCCLPAFILFLTWLPRHKTFRVNQRKHLYTDRLRATLANEEALKKDKALAAVVARVEAIEAMAEAKRMERKATRIRNGKGRFGVAGGVGIADVASVVVNALAPAPGGRRRTGSTMWKNVRVALRLKQLYVDSQRKSKWTVAIEKARHIARFNVALQEAKARAEMAEKRAAFLARKANRRHSRRAQTSKYYRYVRMPWELYLRRPYLRFVVFPLKRLSHWAVGDVGEWAGPAEEKMELQRTDRLLSRRMVTWSFFDIVDRYEDLLAPYRGVSYFTCVTYPTLELGVQMLMAVAAGSFASAVRSHADNFSAETQTFVTLALLSPRPFIKLIIKPKTSRLEMNVDMLSAFGEMGMVFSGYLVYRGEVTAEEGGKAQIILALFAVGLPILLTIMGSIVGLCAAVVPMGKMIGRWLNPKFRKKLRQKTQAARDGDKSIELTSLNKIQDDDEADKDATSSDGEDEEFDPDIDEPDDIEANRVHSIKLVARQVSRTITRTFSKGSRNLARSLSRTLSTPRSSFRSASFGRSLSRREERYRMYDEAERELLRMDQSVPGAASDASDDESNPYDRIASRATRAGGGSESREGSLVVTALDGSGSLRRMTSI